MLRTNAKPSLRYAAAMMLDDFQYRSVQGICSTVENGRPAVANVLGAGLFEYLTYPFVLLVGPGLALVAAATGM